MGHFPAREAKAFSSGVLNAVALVITRIEWQGHSVVLQSTYLPTFVI